MPETKKHKGEGTVYKVLLILAFVVAIVLGLGVSRLPQVRRMFRKLDYTMEKQDKKEKDKDTGKKRLKEHDVEITGRAFNPATLTVKAGQKVDFENADSLSHSATADDGSFDTGPLEFDQGKKILFSTPGTYPYHDSFQPESKGVIIVEASN